MKTISTNELQEMMKSRKPDHILIDVREEYEIKNHGAIPTSINIPMMQLPEKLKRYKDKKIIFYCRTGNRSSRATEWAITQGYDAYNYKGSVLEWSKIDENVKMY
jgi:rhodanese-related sulfurtransferase